MILASRRNLNVVVPAALTALFLLLTTAATQVDEHVEEMRFRSPVKSLTVIAATDPGTLALGAARQFYSRAPVVIIAATGDTAGDTLAAGAARRLQAPALRPGPGLATELDRLNTRQILVIGDTGPLAGIDRITAKPTTATVDKAIASIEALLPLRRAEPAARGVVVITRSATADALALGTASNAGASIIELPGGDPRKDPAVAARLASEPSAPVVALGSTFTRDLPYTLDVVRRPSRLPGGGHVLFPGRTMVALYGHPGSPALGVLGESGLRASIAAAKRKAHAYQKLAKTPVVPAFEIIATVATAAAGKDKDYSHETPLPLLKTWVEAAGEAGMYVVLDLQPGRSDFLAQAKRYESLLALPHVGLALDPEWRLKKHERPLQQIGSVDVAEINRTSTWLAALTRRHVLPQKLLILHQFQHRMIGHRDRLDNSHAELSILIHVDGQGPQPAKQGTWRAIRKGAPRGVFWGWKNFYDEDVPTLSVARTWRTVRPRPDFISYQ